MTSTALFNDSGTLKVIFKEVPVKCHVCDGNGYTIEANYGSTIGCCSRPNPDGSCCGNGIPIQTCEPEQVQCRACNAIPYHSALDRIKREAVEVEDQKGLKQIMLGYLPDNCSSFPKGAIIPFVAEWTVVKQYKRMFEQEWTDGWIPTRDIITRKIARLVNHV